jgi:hypothetical protein
VEVIGIQHRDTEDRENLPVIARSAKRDEAISAAELGLARDCFAEFILGPAEGRTRGLAMT